MKLTVDCKYATVMSSLLMLLVIVNIVLSLVQKHITRLNYRSIALLTLTESNVVDTPRLYMNELSPEEEFNNTEVLDLAIAIQQGDSNKVIKLIETDIDINSCAKCGLPLILWSVFRNFDYAELMLNKSGFEPNQTLSTNTMHNESGNRGLLLRLDGASILAASEYYRLKFKACGGTLANDFGKLSSLLIEKGADPNLGTAPPLSLAVEAGDIDEVLFLLDKGADVNLITIDHNNESTPLLTAIQNLNFEMALLLVEHGAKCDLKTISGRDVQRILLLYSTLDTEKREAVFSQYCKHNHDISILYYKNFIRPRFEDSALMACRYLMDMLTKQGIDFDSYAPFHSQAEYEKTSETGLIMRLNDELFESLRSPSE